MKIAKLKNLIGGLTLSVVVLASGATTALATPANQPPGYNPQASGPQTKPPVEPGSQDAKQTEKLGETNLRKTDKEGKLDASEIAPLAGNVANVDFQSPLNYCWKNLVYTPVRNTTASTKYLHILVWNQGMYRDYYTSVAANSYVYPSFYGVEGTYYAYMYVWNGTNYQYDEYTTSSNTCSVSVTRTYNTAGWVQLKIQNFGTAYATQVSNELAPYPATGTYTGIHYDYPAPGGAAIYRWFYVGTLPYGIVSTTYGSSNSPYYFTGDL